MEHFLVFFLNLHNRYVRHPLTKYEQKFMEGCNWLPEEPFNWCLFNDPLGVMCVHERPFKITLYQLKVLTKPYIKAYNHFKTFWFTGIDKVVQSI